MAPWIGKRHPATRAFVHRLLLRSGDFLKWPSSCPTNVGNIAYGKMGLAPHSTASPFPLI